MAQSSLLPGPSSNWGELGHGGGDEVIEWHLGKVVSWLKDGILTCAGEHTCITITVNILPAWSCGVTIFVQLSAVGSSVAINAAVAKLIHPIGAFGGMGSGPHFIYQQDFFGLLSLQRAAKI